MLPVCDLVVCLDGGLVTVGVCKAMVVAFDDGFEEKLSVVVETPAEVLTYWEVEDENKDLDVEPDGIRDAVDELKEDVGLLVLNEGTDVFVEETKDLVVDVLGIEVVTYSVTTVLFAVTILTVVEVVIPSEVYKRVVVLPSCSHPRSWKQNPAFAFLAHSLATTLTTFASITLSF